jgi:hypothetical protein
MLEGLAAGRERLNALFAAARRGTDLSPAAFRQWVLAGIAPAVDAVAAQRPERAGAVLEALFERSLELTAQRVLGDGAADPAVTTGWLRLLPALPSLLAADPEGLSASIVNALHRLATTDGARPEEWTAALLRAGPRCADLGAFRDAGLVAAWRAGLAQYREQALALARRLDPALASLVLGLEGLAPDALPAVLDGAEADPWRSLEELREGPWGEPRLALVGSVGGFRGFGGLFPVPPRLEARQGALFARAGGGCWRLFADCHGAVFLPQDAPDPDALAPPPGTDASVGEAGEVRHRGLTATFQELAGPTSWATDGATLAVSIATSHAVYLVARR